MSSVINPVGPQPPATYWRRRLLVGLAVLVVVILLWWLIFGMGGGSSPQPAAAPSATPSATSSGSGSPSPSATNECSDNDIDVTVDPGGSSFKVGTQVTFKMQIKNVGDQACQRNVGPKVNSFEVTSGGVHVWSSDDCSPEGGDQVETIPPGGAYAVQAVWNQKLTSPGCPTPQQSAAPGSYDVVGSNASVKSKPVTFALTS